MLDHETDGQALALERLVLHSADTEVRNAFADALIARAFAERELPTPDPATGGYRLLQAQVAAGEISLAPGRVSAAILKAYDEIVSTGLLRGRVAEYIAKGEVDATRFTPRVRDAMIAYLQDIGVDLEDDVKADAGEYDEYLALAYTNAVRAATSSDPIIAARMKTAAEPWNYQVRRYGQIEQQAVVANFILASGALDYVYYLGEMMGAFDFADHVVALWENGVFDPEDDETTTLLFNYRENALQRGTREQRGITYKRVLNLGDAKVMDGVAKNETFPASWGALMAQIVKYNDKVEHDGSTVSKQGIRQALRALQENLTEFGAGGTGKMAHKYSAQLDDAMEILEAAGELLGIGRRRGVWRTIDRLHKEVRGGAIDVDAIRTLAEEGNEIFKIIAEYDESLPDDRWDALINSGLSWVLAEDRLMEGRKTNGAEPETPAASDDEMADDDAGEGAADEWE